MEIDEKSLFKYVEDKVKSANNTTLEQQMYLNIAYYAGKQWIAYDTVNKRLYEPPKPSYKVRFVANRIQPIVRTELAKITKNKPITQVIPASNDDDDIKSAKLADKIINWLWYSLKLQGSNRELAMWALTCGMGYVKPYWNPSKGDMLIHPETGEQVKQGDIDHEIVSPFELKYDPTAKKWSEVKWCCHEKVRTIDYVKDMYNVEVSPESGITSSNIFDAKLMNLNNIGEAINYKNTDDSVIVREFWEKPSSKYPKGRRITVANSKVLFYEEDIGFGEEDTNERILPFFPFIHIIVPGRVAGMSIIENLIGVQREYNKTRSQIIEHKNLMTNPKWVTEQGSLISDITDEPGQVVEYIKGFNAPRVEPMPSLPSDVYNHLERCKEEFDYVSGQHEVSHGGVPTGVKSGNAIAYLQEQDDTKLGPTIANFEDCIQAYTSYMLKIIQAKYDVPRTVKVVGEDNAIDVVTFKGSDITSTDVRVQAGSSLPQSKAAKQDWIINLVQQGILNSVQDKELILKMLELGITDDLYSEFSTDINQAQNENDRFKKGELEQPVRDFYNHLVHIKEHDKFRKSDDYNEMPPEVQQLIDMHVEGHKQFAMQQMIPQQPMTGGAPNGQEITNANVQ